MIPAKNLNIILHNKLEDLINLTNERRNRLPSYKIIVESRWT
ncbi:hypothetical protein ADICYQ_0800 [Cyclobacterium qasimii M12-11B]|uniref:Uncharacterized protein n=1 Tax=Cyclobacterium qasimii M12-11B TaxID=641524 RepID=S7WVM8_9BACT|nr:hypothetical protein ADICYQ_0800 [Cyclobacterium qasimii M12-11B]